MSMLTIEGRHFCATCSASVEESPESSGEAEITVLVVEPSMVEPPSPPVSAL